MALQTFDEIFDRFETNSQNDEETHRLLQNITDSLDTASNEQNNVHADNLAAIDAANKLQSTKGSTGRRYRGTRNKFAIQFRRRCENALTILEKLHLCLEVFADKGISLPLTQRRIIQEIFNVNLISICGGIDVYEHLRVRIKQTWNLEYTGKVCDFILGRRAGKSFAMCVALACMSAACPQFKSTIFNLYGAAAEQNLSYLKDFIQILESDPQQRIHAKFVKITPLHEALIAMDSNDMRDVYRIDLSSDEEAEDDQAGVSNRSSGNSATGRQSTTTTSSTAENTSNNRQKARRSGSNATLDPGTEPSDSGNNNKKRKRDSDDDPISNKARQLNDLSKLNRVMSRPKLDAAGAVRCPLGLVSYNTGIQNQHAYIHTHAHTHTHTHTRILVDNEKKRNTLVALDVFAFGYNQKTGYV